MGTAVLRLFFLDRIKSLRFQISFLFGYGAETGLWDGGGGGGGVGILSNLELIEWLPSLSDNFQVCDLPYPLPTTLLLVGLQNNQAGGVDEYLEQGS